MRCLLVGLAAVVHVLAVSPKAEKPTLVVGNETRPAEGWVHALGLDTLVSQNFEPLMSLRRVTEAVSLFLTGVRQRMSAATPHTFVEKAHMEKYRKAEMKAQSLLERNTMHLATLFQNSQEGTDANNFGPTINAMVKATRTELGMLHKSIPAEGTSLLDAGGYDVLSYLEQDQEQANRALEADRQGLLTEEKEEREELKYAKAAALDGGAEAEAALAAADKDAEAAEAAEEAREPSAGNAVDAPASLLELQERATRGKVPAAVSAPRAAEALGEVRGLPGPSDRAGTRGESPPAPGSAETAGGSLSPAAPEPSLEQVAHELNHELTPYELGVRDAHATQTEVADEPKKELSPYELGVRDALAAGRGTVSCGGHTAPTCEACTQGLLEGLGESWCNGECAWREERCQRKAANAGGNLRLNKGTHP